MKKKTFLVLALTVVLGLCGCGGAGTAPNASGMSEVLQENETIQPETSVEDAVSAETETESVAESVTETVEETVTETENPPATQEEPTQEESTPSTEPEETEMTYEIDPTKPMIAITFDDGPNTTTTVQILNLLVEYNVRATFFVIGDNINDRSGEVMKRAYELGCEINNHSKTHQNMPGFTADEIKAEIEYTSNKVEEIIGVAPNFFRPPYIAVNDTMYDAIDMPFICGYGCNDWENDVTAEMRATKTLEQACDGAIILLHDFSGNSQTVEALKTIIPSLLDQGYQLVTVTELFEAKGVEIKADDKNLYSVVK